MSRAGMNINLRVWRYAEDMLARLGFGYDFYEKSKRLFNRVRFGKKQQLEFIEDFKSWLDDGGNVRQACDAIIKSAHDLGEEDKSYVKVAQDIRQAVIEGRNIADGMDMWFDEQVIMVFVVGQESDTLGEMLASYTEQLEEISQARKDFLKPVLYPLFVCSAALGVALLFATQILPQFRGVIPMEMWEPSSVRFMQTYEAIAARGISALLGTVIIIMATGWWMINGDDVLRRKVQNRFPFNIYSYLLAMKLIKMLSLLVGRVYNPREAAARLRKTATPFLAWHLNEIVRREDEGSVSIAHSLNTGLIPSRLIQRMESTSALGDADSRLRALESAGRRSGNEAMNAIKRSKRVVVLLLWLLALGQLGWTFTSFAGVLLAMMQQI